jgi:hypothetical protein
MSSRTNSRSSKVSSVVDAVNNLFAEFLNSQANTKGKIKVEDALEALKSDEMVAKINEIATAFLPKRKVSQKLKDPAAPKKPPTAYVLFCKDERPTIKSELPDLKPQEVMAELGARWKALKEKKKLKYKKKEDEFKIEYKKVMESYERPSDEELVKLKVNQPKVSSARGKKRKPRAKKDPRAPKGKRTAYIFFCQDMKDEIKATLGDDATAQEVRLELARVWGEDYKEDEKASRKWVKMAKKDKKRYEKEMEAYKETLENDRTEEEPEEEPEREPERKLKKRKVVVEMM